MYHSFLTHSSADGHLGCFHVLAIVNSAVITIPLLSIHTEETKIERDNVHPNVHRSTVYNSQDMAAT